MKTTNYFRLALIAIMFFCATNSGFAQYCTSMASTPGDEEIFNVTVETLYNTSDCNTTGGGNSQLGQYSDFTTIVQAPDLMMGSTVSFSIEIGTCGGDYPSGTGIFIDFDQNGSLEDPGEKVYVTTITTNGPHFVTGDFVIPSDATPGITLMRVINAEEYSGDMLTACLNYGYGETEDYYVNIIGGTPCTGTPDAGNTIASVDSACANSTFLLSISGSNPGISDLTYQWQSSADNITYSDISGATKSTLTINQISPAYYRCIISCTNSGLSATSTPRLVYMKTLLNCYCIPGVTNYECTYMYITNVTTTGGISNFNNTTVCDSSFVDFSGSIIASQVQGSDLSMAFSSFGYPLGYSVWIDFNDDANFDSSEQVISVYTGNLADVTASFTVPLSAAPGTHRMRVRGEYENPPGNSCNPLNAGETEDYGFTVIALTPCSGTVTGGITASTANTVCSGENFTLSLSGATIAFSGITFQWQSSADNVTFTNIPGATNPTFTTNQTVATYYRCNITCTNSGSSDISTPLLVTMNAFYDCYCVPQNPPCSGDYISNFRITGTSLDNTSTCNTTADNKAYSNFPALGSSTAVLIVGNNYTFSVTTTNNNLIALWIDFNQNGIFDTNEWTQVNASSTASVASSVDILIPDNAVPGTTKVRIRTTNVWDFMNETSACQNLWAGETEDYYITFIYPTPCSGTPLQEGTLSSVNSVCSGTVFTLSLSGENDNTIIIGLIYQWQSSPDNLTYTNITGATEPVFTTNQNSSNYYRCLITCSNTGLSSPSIPLIVSMNPFFNCYCIPSNPPCSTSYISNFNIPETNLNNTTTCTTSDGKAYSSFPADSTTTAELIIGNPYTINVTTTSNDIISLWIDYNQSGTFDAGEWAQIATSSTPGVENSISVTIPGNALPGTSKLRIRTRASGSQNGASNSCTSFGGGETEDYFISLKSLVPCTGTPEAGSISSDKNNLCPGAPFNLSLFGATNGLVGLNYQWQSSADGNSYNNIPGAVALTYSDTAGISTYYRFIAVCDSSGLSDTTSAFLLNGVAPPSFSIVTSGPTAFCNGGSVTLDAGFFSGFQWSTGEVTRSIITTSTGTYSVTVTNNYACTGSASLAITDTCSVNMKNGSSVTCYTNFYDSGGPTNNYFINENFTYTFYPYTSNKIKIEWQSFISQTCCDKITIYDSDTIDGSKIVYGPSGGNLSIPTFTSTHLSGALTIRFQSNGSTNNSGWAAVVSCVPIPGCSTLVATATAGNILCNGGTTTVTLSASGGSSPYLGTGNFTVTAGTHEYAVTDAQGCVSNTTIIVTEPNLLSATAISGNILCSGGTGPITVTAEGGISPYTGTGTFLEPAGTYNYTVTDANGCTDSTSVVHIEPPALMINPNVGTIVCAGDSVPVTISATGGTSPYSGTGTFIKITGTYSFSVIDASGCPVDSILTISEPAPLIAQTTADPIACNGQTTLITVTASGGVPPYSGTGTFTESIGNYNYVISDANGCMDSTSINITQPAGLSVNVTTGEISCKGGNTIVTVTASGGTAPYSGTGNFVVTAGIYNYVVSDIKGCSDTVAVPVSEPPILNANSVAGNILCNGNTTTVTVSASGGTSPYSGTGDFIKNAGNYTLIVTDSNSCTASTSITIIEPPAISLSVGSAASTCGFSNGSASVVVAGGTPTYTYIWTPTGQTTNFALNLPQGIYTVKVTDSNSCTSTANIGISDIGGPAISVISSTDATCKDVCDGTANVSVTGSGGPFTITWSNGETGENAVALCAGNNVVSAVDTNNCFVNHNILINEPQPVQLTLSKTDVTCNGNNNGTATATATGGTGVISFSWSNGQTTQTAIGLTAGCYTVTATDQNNCTASTEICVTQPSALSLSNGTINATCNGLCNGEATAIITGGVLPYTTLWSNGLTDLIASGICAGVYTATATDANGCTASAGVTISEPAELISTTISDSILCKNGTASITVSASGGTSPYLGTGSFVKPAGTFNFTVNDANGCVANTLVTLTEPATLTASSGSDNILCFGGTATITVSASGGTPPYAGTGNFIAPAGTYNYTVSDFNGCSAGTSVLITQPPALNAASSPGTILCNGGSATVTIIATGGVSPYTGTGIFTQNAGSINYIVTDANGCSVTVPVTITEPELLTVSTSTGNILCFGGTTMATITGSGGTSPYNYFWSNGATTQTITNVNTGMYIGTAIDSKGCSVNTPVSIPQPTQLTVNISSTNILCNGGTSDITVNAVGGTAPYSGEGNFSVNAGTYNYIITDSNGCTTSANTTITQPNDLVVSSTTGTILCNGDTTSVTVSATGGTTPYTGTGNFTKTAGTYNFIVNDANGCLDSVSVTLTQPSALSVNAVAGPIVCYGTTTTVDVTAGGGISPYSGTGSFMKPSGVYNFTVTDLNGCVANASLTINEPGTAPISATANSTNILCYGQTANVVISASGGTSPYGGTGTFSQPADVYEYVVTDAMGCKDTVTVTLTEPATLISSSTAGTISCFSGTTTVVVTASGGTTPYTGTGNFTVNAGTYDYTVTDANGCTSLTTVSITEPLVLTIGAGTGSILCNGGTAMVMISANGGTPPYTGTGIFDVPAGSYNFMVTDSKGCFANYPLILSEPDLLEIFVDSIKDASSYTSNDGSVSMTVIGGTSPYTYKWSHNFSLNAPIALNLKTGNYTITVTDNNNCKTIMDSLFVDFSTFAATKLIDDFHISIFPNPTSGIFNVKIINQGDFSAQLTIFNILGEQVFSSGKSSAKDLYEYKIKGGFLSKGIYNLQIKSGNGIFYRKLVVK